MPAWVVALSQCKDSAGAGGGWALVGGDPAAALSHGGLGACGLAGAQWGRLSYVAETRGQAPLRRAWV